MNPRRITESERRAQQALRDALMAMGRRDRCINDFFGGEVSEETLDELLALARRVRQCVKRVRALQALGESVQARVEAEEAAARARAGLPEPPP